MDRERNRPESFVFPISVAEAPLVAIVQHQRDSGIATEQSGSQEGGKRRAAYENRVVRVSMKAVAGPPPVGLSDVKLPVTEPQFAAFVVLPE